MKRILFLLILVAQVRAAEPTNQRLQEQIDELQAKVRQLESSQQHAIGAQESAATVDKVVGDAEQRSKLFPDGTAVTAGFENGRFFLRSQDGSFSLSPTAYFQFRSVTNFNRAGDDSIENGFDIRRLKVAVEGNVFGRDLTYRFQWATGVSTGTPRLDDAWVRYQLSPHFAIRAGQFIDPFEREQLVSSKKQLAVDRSLLNQVITGENESYVQGVSAIYEAEKIRAEVAFTDGIGSSDTTFRDFPANSTDFGAAGRVEYLVIGRRADYDDFNALDTKENLLVFGAGGDVTQAGSDTNYLHTIDVQFNSPSGLALYAAYLADYFNSSTGDQYNWGLLAQAGYMLTSRIEPFVRYDFVKLDQPVTFIGDGAEDTFHEFTLGVNWFLHGHAAKITVDGSWLPSGCPTDLTGLGYLAGDENQFVLRGQFQLIF